MADLAYIVIGTTGDYSDRTEWYVACYSTKEQAEEHARRANEWVNNWEQAYEKERIGRPTGSYGSPEMRAYYQHISEWKKNNPTTDNPYDPYCSIDSPIEYGVFETPFVRHVDEYLEHIQDHPKEQP